VLAPARAQGLLKDAPARQAFHPFDPSTRRSEGVYTMDGGEWHAVKGAANVIGPLCKLDASQQAALDAAKRKLAESGARVLAVAAGPADALQLLGLVGLSDPPRPDAANLIAQLTQLGVRVRMATGDSLETARAIGASAGSGHARLRRTRPGSAEPRGLRPVRPRAARRQTPHRRRTTEIRPPSPA